MTLKWHPTEYEAFSNRCTIYYLGTPLTDIFNKKEIEEISKCGPELLYMLSLFNEDNEINNNNVFTKFKEYIYI